jgi:hypothetical protein
MGLSKELVLRSVPFSLLWYVSKPLAAVLTRRRTQLLFFLSGIYAMANIPWNDQYNLDQEFRFSTLQYRGYRHTLPDPMFHMNSSSNAVCPNAPPLFASISSFGVLLDGVDPNIPSQILRAPDGSMIRRYFSPVRWNGWFFVTSSSAPYECDPVRFALHARSGAPGAPWAPAGSSSFARVHVSTVLFHGAFPTPAARGARADLDLARHRIGSLWQSVAAGLALAAAGALRREEFGEPILAAFYAAWVLANLACAATYLRAGQRDGPAVFGLLAATHAGNLLLMTSGRWVYQWLWYGAMQTVVAAVLSPFDVQGAAHPSSAILPVGAVYAAVGAAVTLRSALAVRRAVALVAADRRACDAAWRDAAAERAGELRALERRVARMRARAEADGEPRQARRGSLARRPRGEAEEEAVPTAEGGAQARGRADRHLPLILALAPPSPPPPAAAPSPLPSPPPPSARATRTGFDSDQVGVGRVARARAACRTAAAARPARGRFRAGLAAPLPHFRRSLGPL